MKKMKLACLAAASLLMLSVLAGCSAPASSASAASSAPSVSQSIASEPDSAPAEKETASRPESTPEADSSASQPAKETVVAVTGLRLSATSKSLKPGQRGTLEVYTSPREAAAPEAEGLACISTATRPWSPRR